MTLARRSRCCSSRSSTPTRPSGTSCRRCSSGGVGMAMSMSPMTAAAMERRAGGQGRRRLGQSSTRSARSAARSGSRSWVRSSPRSGTDSPPEPRARRRSWPASPRSLYVAAAVAFAGAVVAARLVRHARSQPARELGERSPRARRMSRRRQARLPRRAPPGACSTTALRGLRRRQLPRRDDGGDRARGGRHASPSSTATSRRSAISTSPASTRRGAACGRLWESAVAASRRPAAVDLGDARRCALDQERRRAPLARCGSRPLAEAGDDDVIRDHLRAHMSAVHEFVREVIAGRRRRAVSPDDRDPGAEAWIFLAGGLLLTVADRLGGLLGEDASRRHRRRRRLRWLSGAETEPVRGRVPGCGPGDTPEKASNHFGDTPDRS